MAVKLGTPANQKHGPSTLAEINVTPLVDVMLVLLIVFMISAPLMQQGIQVDLPKASAGAMDETPDQVVLVIKKNRRILMNDHGVKEGELLQRLKAISSVKPDVEVFIQADESINYGFVAEVMAEIKRANIQKVGLVTQPGNDDKRL